MRFSFGQSQTQKQTQTMAPRMIQSMEILQMAQAALEEKIETELIENPALERVVENQPSEEEPKNKLCLLYTSPSPRDRQKSRMPSSA